MTLFKFKGGIHPPENKSSTEHLIIENFKSPKLLYIPLLQHIGSVCEPLVNVGDRVLKGQKIADSTGAISVPIHSSVSGKVVKIDVLPFTLKGKVNTIVIENDFQEDSVDFVSLNDYKTKSKEELLEKIRELGLVGLGGALFPTHIKLNPPKTKKINTLIINASECEPYLNSDNRISIEKTIEIIKGIDIAMYILGVSEAFIGIENNKKEAIESFEKSLKKSANIKLAVLETKYPQGGERQLIKAICNKHIPTGQLPMDLGIIVINVTTAYWIFNSITNGYPVIEEIVTVSGGAIITPKNYRILIGTPIKEIIETVGVNREKMYKLITGGPMMGITQYSEDVPVIKGTSGILALTPEETHPYNSKACISCGKCVDACPMGLSPLMYAKFAQFERWEKFEEYNLVD